MEEDFSDEAMLAAIRKRLMDEISRSAGGSERIVNNVYGASPFGLVERLNADSVQGAGPDINRYGGEGEDPYEYMVDIDREDKIGPEGEKIGWTKKVRRYRTLTGSPGEKKK